MRLRDVKIFWVIPGNSLISEKQKQRLMKLNEAGRITSSVLTEPELDHSLPGLKHFSLAVGQHPFFSSPTYNSNVFFSTFQTNLEEKSLNWRSKIKVVFPARGERNFHFGSTAILSVV